MTLTHEVRLFHNAQNVIYEITKVFNTWQLQTPISEAGLQPNSNFKQANLVVPIFTYYIQSKI